jgi:hypothetical protein
MHCLLGVGDGDFHSRHKTQPGGRGGGDRDREAAEFVVIGQGEKFDALFGRATHERRGFQGSVGDRRMRVQVGV